MPGRKGHPENAIYSNEALMSVLEGLVDTFFIIVHAATGWDTTSAVYRKGKRVPFRKLHRP